MQRQDGEAPRAPALAVITGASGLVGGNLAALLCGLGAKVRCTRRANSQIAHLLHLPIEWVEADLLDRRGYRFSSDKARRELGYSPGPIEPAIADAIAWFRAHGKLPAATS